MAEAQFRWDDPLLLEQQLTQDEHMMRDAGRAYAQDKLLPRVPEPFRSESSDRKTFAERGHLGPLGSTMREEFGGPGLGYVTYGLIARKIERVDSGYRSMHVSMVYACNEGGR